MTDEQLLTHPRYRKGSSESQQLARELVNYVESKYGVRPFDSANEYLQFPRNFLLIETIHSRKRLLRVNLKGNPEVYDDLKTSHLNIGSGQHGVCKVVVTDPQALPGLFEAVDRSWGRLKKITNTVEPNYWITTHWPPRDGDPERAHKNIYLQDGREGAGKKLRAGDLVMIYESQSGRTLVKRRIDGTTERVPCQSGRSGIVTIAEVASGFEEIPDSRPESYADGSKVWWRWCARTRSGISSGFVPRRRVNQILGLKPDYNFRGFGDSHSGLKEVNKEQFEALLQEFKQRQPITPLAPEGEEPPPGRSFEGSGGESFEHRSLKEYVATHPNQVFGESGLSLVRVEYPFVTGDRADIAMKDKLGRLIGIEIELAQLDGEHDGVLQAIKYRHMLALMFGVRFSESRSFLVAHRISPSVRKLCTEYSVECFIVDRAAVTSWTESLRVSVDAK
jgi:hypothetical protein